MDANSGQNPALSSATAAATTAATATAIVTSTCAATTLIIKFVGGGLATHISAFIGRLDRVGPLGWVRLVAHVEVALDVCTLRVFACTCILALMYVAHSLCVCALLPMILKVVCVCVSHDIEGSVCVCVCARARARVRVGVGFVR
jgi:hypothetical protein